MNFGIALQGKDEVGIPAPVASSGTGMLSAPDIIATRQNRWTKEMQLPGKIQWAPDRPLLKRKGAPSSATNVGVTLAADRRLIKPRLMKIPTFHLKFQMGDPVTNPQPLTFSPSHDATPWRPHPQPSTGLTRYVIGYDMDHYRWSHQGFTTVAST